MIKLLLACGLLMSPVPGNAENRPSMVIYTTSGDYQIFISDNPKMTYHDNLLVIRNDRGLTVSVEAADVRSFQFNGSDTPTGIRTADAAARSGSVLSGLTAGSRIDVFGLDGKLVKSLKADKEGTAEIDFRQLPKGILVIKTEKGSLKIKH